MDMNDALAYLNASREIDRLGPSSSAEAEALIELVGHPSLNIERLQKFMAVAWPKAILRDRPDIPTVGVADKNGKQHVAPESGPDLVKEVEYLLVNAGNMSNPEFHNHFCYLMPFTFGNGLAARAL